MYRKLCDIYDSQRRPSEITFKGIVEIFQRSNSVEDQRTSKYSRSVHAQENMDFVRASVVEGPKMLNETTI